MTAIQANIKNYLQTEFIDNADLHLTPETPLLSSGIIDSISALQLVEFLETTYNFKFQAHEVDQDNLDSLTLIEAFIQSKTVSA